MLFAVAELLVKTSNVGEHGRAKSWPQSASVPWCSANTDAVSAVSTSRTSRNHGRAGNWRWCGTQLSRLADTHQPYEPPPSTPHLEPIIYTQPPPPYSLHASYYISQRCCHSNRISTSNRSCCLHCVQKKMRPKSFLVISPIKLGHFWWYLIHRYTNKFAAKSLFMYYVAPSLRYGSFLDNFPCHTAGDASL